MKIKKQGTLCFWGDWFGRPYDNIHTVIRAKHSRIKDTLTLYFSDKEICTVVSPRGIVNLPTDFYIADAEKIIFQWYYYGRPSLPENLCTRTYDKIRDMVHMNSSGPARSSKVFPCKDHFALRIF